MTTPHPTGSPPEVWKQRWFQLLLAALVALCVAWIVLPPIFGLIYMIRSVLLPVLIALGLAYICNPLVSLMQKKLRWPRVAGTLCVMGTAAFALLIVLLVAVPPLVSQTTDLVRKIKDVYPGRLLQHLNIEAERPPATAPSQDQPIAEAEPAPTGQPAATQPHRGEESLADRAAWWRHATNNERLRELLGHGGEGLKNLRWEQVRDFLLSSMDIGLGAAGAAIGFTAYLLFAAVVITFSFFFFSWRFDAISTWLGPYIPKRYREETVRVVHKMDVAVAASIRGRLIQAAVMCTVLTIGWWVCGVPAFLLLAIITGLLNVVPYTAWAGGLVAVLVSVADHAGGGGLTLGAALWPAAVYLAAQLFDGWVMEPLVQSKATDLNPLAILLAVMIGASLAGLLGMLLAIPTTACIKILLKDVVLPRLRAAAEG